MSLLIMGAELLRIEAAEWRARNPDREGMGRDRATHERIARSLEAAATAMEKEAKG